MTALFIGMAVLAGLVALALVRPLIRREAQPAVRAEYDLTVFRDQLKEIERDAEEGLLDAEAAEAARIEVQRRLLAADEELKQAAQTENEASRGARGILPFIIAGSVPAAAAVMYLVQGSPEQPDQPFAARDIPAETASAQTAQQSGEMADMNAMIGRLAEKLLSNPEDIEGWLLLGRSYLSMERFDEAKNAYARARDVAQGRPDVEVAYAEALILTSEMKVTDEAASVLQAVHESTPFEPKARYYLGLKKAQSGDLKAALQDWADLVAISDEEAPWVPLVRQQIARAADELGIDPRTITMSADARKLIASRPPVLRPTTPIMPTEPPAAAAQPEAPAGQPGPTREQMEAAQEMSAEDRAAMIQGMVQRLAERLKENPDDLAGWQRLERAYRVMGEAEKADEAAAQIKRLSGR